MEVQWHLHILTLSDIERSKSNLNHVLGAYLQVIHIFAILIVLGINLNST